MIAYYIWDAKSPMILSQFFARMTPLATRMPREPRDMALETSFLVTIPAPHSSSVLFFAFATASAEPLTVFGLCSETDLPVPIRSGGSTATNLDSMLPFCLILRRFLHIQCSTGLALRVCSLLLVYAIWELDARCGLLWHLLSLILQASLESHIL